jgi:hypothetical protein
VKLLGCIDSSSWMRSINCLVRVDSDVLRKRRVINDICPYPRQRGLIPWMTYSISFNFDIDETPLVQGICKAC